ncbi:SAM-dependent methyltransferase [Acaryochloris sp. IP29b_bin.148]|uniref:SAM-dependent methyltransferase n=1 Tax=Acaryochloris sp. IP29b_bin.148 TaxID=2969218 RepID=UPI002602B4BE|nr:SAM-dependent methyltransferase [Acaryochloris sp. IP29b_bin.148]
MDDTTGSDVSFTAKIMAAGRAYETQRSDALFIDPFAEKLAGEEVVKHVIPRLEKDEKKGKPFTLVRTRFFDDFIINHAQNIRQIVLLGAGMDTRALRMKWESGTHVYEIDQSNIMAYKESILKDIKPTCVQHSISADLKDSLWSELLFEQGYQSLEPSIWLLEGLLYYLNEVEVHNLLTTITNCSAKGSWFGADVINSVILNGQDDWAKYWQSSCDDPESFFEKYGWKASAIQPGEKGASFGRFTFQFPERSIPDTPHLFFITASKQV